MSASIRTTSSADGAQLPSVPAPNVSTTHDRLTDAQLMREEVEALCSHMLWMRAWWACHEQAIRDADRKAASCVHDHFIDGAMFARSIARGAGFDLDEDRMRNYSWGRSVQNVRIGGGGQ